MMRRHSLLDCTEADFRRINFDHERKKIESDTHVVSTSPPNLEIEPRRFTNRPAYFFLGITLGCLSICWICYPMLAEAWGSTQTFSLPLPEFLRLHISGLTSSNKPSIPTRDDIIHRALHYTAPENICSAGKNIKVLSSHLKSGEETVQDLIHSITFSTLHYRLSLKELLPEYLGISEHAAQTYENCLVEMKGLFDELTVINSKVLPELEQLKETDSSSMARSDGEAPRPGTANSIREIMSTLSSQTEMQASQSRVRLHRSTQTALHSKIILGDIAAALYLERVPLSYEHLNDTSYWRVLLTPYHNMIHDLSRTAAKCAQLYIHIDEAKTWSFKTEDYLEVVKTDMGIFRDSLNGMQDSEVEAGFLSYVDALKTGVEKLTRIRRAQKIGTGVKAEL